METAVIALVFVAVWYAWRRHAHYAALKHKAEQEAAESARAAHDALPRPRIDLSRPGTAHTKIETWEVDFLAMRAVWEIREGGVRSPFHEHSSEHSLRRAADGRWEMRETERSHAAEVKKERARYEERKADHAESGSRTDMPEWRTGR